MVSIQPLEKEIQLAICDYLEMRCNQGKFIFWRQNVIPPFDKKTGHYRPMSKYTRTGVPDIIVVKNGVFIGLEVKRKGEKQNDAQINFQNDLERAGGKYFVVRSVIDVINIGL